MGPRKPQDARGREDFGPTRLLVIFVGIIVIFFIIRNIAVFLELVVLFLGVFPFFVVFLLGIVGNRVKRHGMRLGNLQLAFTFGATQDFALFHFVFVHINFSGAFRTAEHVSILRVDFQPAGFLCQGAPTGVLYTRRVNRKEDPFTGYSV
jgi:Na+/proline symporter